MKKIIDGKKYDTDTAQQIAEYSNMTDVRDFHYTCETLYRKRTGEYFIYGEGGPMTQYAESRGQNLWSGGQSISPVDYDTAREWMEGHASVDAYEKEFGDIDDDGTRVVKTLSLASADAERLARKASEAGMSQSELVTSLLEKL